jgi:hypothetical protein
MRSVSAGVRGHENSSEMRWVDEKAAKVAVIANIPCVPQTSSKLWKRGLPTADRNTFVKESFPSFCLSSTHHDELGDRAPQL